MNEIQYWSLGLSTTVYTAVEQRAEREKAFIKNPDGVANLLYNWFPGTVKMRRDGTAQMSCRAPLFGADYVRIQNELEKLKINSAVKMLILDVDSPGGEVCLCKETADAIKNFGKPTAAFACGMMCSAAYWLGSQCDKVFASESTTVGSIGVIAAHISIEKMLSEQGISITEVARGEKKNQYSSSKELTKEAKKNLSEQVDYHYGKFIDSVKGTRKDISEEVFDSGTYSGENAIAVGLVDKIENRIDSLMED